MMPSAPDGSPLTEEQRLAAEHLASATSISPADAVAVLASHHWDHNAALRSTVGGNSGSRQQAAQAQPGWVWWLATAPYHIGRSLVSGLLGYGATEGVRREEQEWETFLREFEAEYGPGHPAFFQGAFNEALARARSEGRLMLLYLHSEHHASTPAFCRGTLCAPAVAAYAAQHFVVWAGDVRHAAAFTLSNALEVSEFPFLAVLSAAGAAPAIIARVAGAREPTELVAALAAAVEGPGAAIAEQARRAARDRELLDERNRAYQESLAADQEKDRKRAEEEARARREAEAKAARASREAAARESRARALAATAEPAQGAPDTASVAVRLPDGSRVSRRFAASDPLSLVFALADAGVPDGGAYRLCTNFPRREYAEEGSEAMTLRDAGLCPQALLFLTRVEEDAEAGAPASAPSQ